MRIGARSGINGPRANGSIPAKAASESSQRKQPPRNVAARVLRADAPAVIVLRGAFEP